MPKVSDALREKLLGRKQAMENSILISNKGFTKKILRIIPVKEGGMPGMEYISFFCPSLNYGTTGLETWGLKCAIRDFFEQLKLKGTKDQKEHAYKIVRQQRETWIGVIDRSDEGTPDAPKIRVLQAKNTYYKTILDHMLDEDTENSDITDANDGRDIKVTRVGSGKDDTEWTCLVLPEIKPIHDSEDMFNALVELASNFDVQQHMYKTDWTKYCNIYEALTGDKVPASYLKQPGLSKWLATDKDKKERKDRPAPVRLGGSKPAETAAPVEQPDAGNDNSNVVELGDTVSFSDGENDHEGPVIALEVPGQEGFIKVEADGQEWEVPDDAVTITAKAETEPEPEPVRRAVARPAVRSVMSTKATAKPTAKPTLRKPAPAAKATAKPSGKPSASSAIRARIAAGKKKK